MIEEDTLSDGLSSSAKDSPTHLSQYSAGSKILSECYDVLVAQKEKLRSSEPTSVGVPFLELGETVRPPKCLCSNPVLTAGEHSLARQYYWRC